MTTHTWNPDKNLTKKVDSLRVQTLNLEYRISEYQSSFTGNETEIKRLNSENEIYRETIDAFKALLQRPTFQKKGMLDRLSNTKERIRQIR